MTDPNALWLAFFPLTVQSTESHAVGVRFEAVSFDSSGTRFGWLW